MLPHNSCIYDHHNMQSITTYPPLLPAERDMCHAHTINHKFTSNYEIFIMIIISFQHVLVYPSILTEMSVTHHSIQYEIVYPVTTVSTDP